MRWESLREQLHCANLQLVTQGNLDQRELYWDLLPDAEYHRAVSGLRAALQLCLSAYRDLIPNQELAAAAIGDFVNWACALIAVTLLAGIPSAIALTSQPAQHLPSVQEHTIRPELVRRWGLFRPRYRSRGPRHPRQYVTPETKAAPMQGMPPVVPLAPRVGN